MIHTAPTHSKGNVLLVEDTEAVRKALRRALERARYTVQDVDNSEQARRLLQRSHFDAVATDIHLPGEDGMTLLRAVEQEHPELPVVIMTGDPKLGTAIEAVEHRAFSYLTKPFAATRFVAVIGKAIDARRPARGSSPDIDLACLERGFNRAVPDIYLAFQPIVNVSDGRVGAYEALLRCNTPGFLTPRDVLAAAESLDRMWDVGRRVRKLATEFFCQDLAPQQLFVNIHPHDLLDDELYMEHAALRRYADRVVFELTEREALEHIPGAKRRISELSELGYRIAIDDLGAGYSSLNYLTELKPDVVKIDRSIVSGVDRDANKSRMVSLLAKLCHEMGIEVVGEGVETESVRDRLVELGCDRLQGYLFGFPCPYLLGDGPGTPEIRS